MNLHFCHFSGNYRVLSHARYFIGVGNTGLTFEGNSGVHRIQLIIDREAGEIIRLVASMCLFVCLCLCLFVRVLLFGSYFVAFQPVFSTGAHWSILVLGFAKYSKRSSGTQVSYTLKKTS